MRLLLTGASGFVGQRLVEMMPDDWNIVSLGRKETEGVHQWIECDLSNYEHVLLASEEIKQKKFDAIIHLAAFVPKTSIEDTIESAMAGNIKSTVNLLECFGDTSTKIILGSTAEVYDQKHTAGLISEDNIVGPLSYYGATKLGSEFIARAYAEKNNKEITILRFSVMYGGYDPINRALPIFIKSAIRGEPISVHGSKVLRDYVHIDDIVNSIICSVKTNGAGIVNIGTGSGVSIIEAANSVVNLTKSSSNVVIESEEGGADIVLDITKARDTIGYKPRVFFPDKLAEMIMEYEQ